MWSRLVCSQRKPAACRRVAARSGYWAKRRRAASASAGAVRSVISTPASGALTASGVPQTAVAMTGVPQAIASSSTFAIPSRLDARTSASAAL